MADDNGNNDLEETTTPEQDVATDLVPYWVAFVVAFMILFGSVVLLRCYWDSKKKCKANEEERKKFDEEIRSYMCFVAIVVCDFLLLAGMQKDFIIFAYVACVLSVVCFVLFFLEVMFYLCNTTFSFSEWIYRACWKDDFASKFVAIELLEDMGSEVFKDILIGCAQATLLVVYELGIVRNGPPDFGDWHTYVYYYIGVFLTSAYMVGKDHPKRSYESLVFWSQIVTALKKGEILKDEERNKVIKLSEYRISILFRLALDIFMSGGGLLTIAMLLPIQLASSEHFTDFVLNSVAIFFLLELDDLDEEKEFVYLYPYEPVTEERTRVRIDDVQLIDNECPDPTSKHKNSKDEVVLYMTFSNEFGSVGHSLQDVHLLQKTTENNFKTITSFKKNTEHHCESIAETKHIRLPLQLCAGDSDKQPRKPYRSNDHAALVITIAPGVGPLMRIYEKNKGEAENKYEESVTAQTFRLPVRFLESFEVDPDPSGSSIEENKNIALFLDTETKEFSLLQCKKGNCDLRVSATAICISCIILSALVVFSPFLLYKAKPFLFPWA